MPIATLTSKGRVTIPKSIRERLGLDQGDRVEFALEEDGALRLKPLSRSVRELAGFLFRPDQPARTIAEINDSIAETVDLRS